MIGIQLNDKNFGFGNINNVNDTNKSNTNTNQNSKKRKLNIFMIEDEYISLFSNVFEWFDIKTKNIRHSYNFDTFLRNSFYSHCSIKLNKEIPQKIINLDNDEISQISQINPLKHKLNLLEAKYEYYNILLNQIKELKFAINNLSTDFIINVNTDYSNYNVKIKIIFNSYNIYLFLNDVLNESKIILEHKKTSCIMVINIKSLSEINYAIINLNDEILFSNNNNTIIFNMIPYKNKIKILFDSNNIDQNAVFKNKFYHISLINNLKLYQFTKYTNGYVYKLIDLNERKIILIKDTTQPNKIQSNENQLNKTNTIDELINSLNKCFIDDSINKNTINIDNLIINLGNCMI